MSPYHNFFLNRLDLSSLCNIPETYINQTRQVKPEGAVITPNLILKLYNMHIKGTDTSKEKINNSINFLESEINKNNINPYLGFGFAILSESNLNVARWDSTYPILLQNQLYEFQKEDLSDIKKLDIGTSGSFCIWELKIVDFERKEWQNFLDSRRTDYNKKKYLTATLTSFK